jgi:protein ImuB
LFQRSAMRLWIGLHLPLLPLESFRPHWCEPGAHVVIDHERALAMTPEAAASGVRVGMRRGGVLTVCPDAALYQRDNSREQAALDGIALTLLQYTPEVAHAEECSLLLDISASLRAFGGCLALCKLVRDSMRTLGFTAQLSMAPTAQGAWLLARYPANRVSGMPRRALKMRTMQRRLDGLVFAVLPAARPYADWLEGIGCRTLGDLRKLPRAGLQRRCSKELLDGLDRAHGDAPELFAWVVPPQTFSGSLELPDRIEHAEAVLFGARRLILQMTGWLMAHQLAVARFILLLEHERGRTAIAPTAIEIALAEPAWQEQHLTRLLKERLGRTALPAAVIALRLQAPHTAPMTPVSESLFPEPGGTPADFKRLLELLTARLGSENVLVPAPLADYRPEAGNGWMPALLHKPGRAVLPQATERPFWLLEKPIALQLRDHRPFYGSSLKLIRGPERIECGWWDAAAIARDYFIAQGEQAACYWVYRERSGNEAQWFLHGLFA